MRTIAIRSELLLDLPDCRPVGRFSFYREPGHHLLEVIDLVGIPSTADKVLADLAVALGIGVSVNLFQSDRQTDGLRPEAVQLQIDDPLHPGWWQIVARAGDLAHVQIDLQAAVDRPGRPQAQGSAHLVSGGKDTLFALHQEHQQQSLCGRPGVFLGAGSEINWPTELPQVHRIARHYGLVLNHVMLLQEMNSSRGGLRLANRGAWRELVTITLARCLGNRIVTGINNDVISRMQVIVPNLGLGDFLGNLIPTVQDLERVLEAEITTVPGELEVYRRIRHHPLFDIGGSCVRPNCGQPELCVKCRLFGIYDRVIDGKPLQPDDIAFVNSDHFMGDPELLNLAARPAEGRHDVINLRVTV